MQTVVLTRKDLVNLVNGVEPSYDQMSMPLIEKNGSYTGGFKDEWTWHIQDDVTEGELIEMYNICKDWGLPKDEDIVPYWEKDK